MSWKEIKKRADQEVGDWMQAPPIGRDLHPNIESFYPELYNDDQVIGQFSNTIGSHLIADILTSNCVIVALSNRPDETDLIRRYGVDLAFLTAPPRQ